MTTKTSECACAIVKRWDEGPATGGLLGVAAALDAPGAGVRRGEAGALLATVKATRCGFIVALWCSGEVGIAWGNGEQGGVWTSRSFGYSLRSVVVVVHGSGCRGCGTEVGSGWGISEHSASLPKLTATATAATAWLKAMKPCGWAPSLL